MKTFKSFAIILFLTLSLSQLSYADDGNSIYSYYRSMMTPTKLSLDDLDKITFSNNGIQMWSQNGMREITFEDFLLFTFTEIEHPYVSSVEPIFASQEIEVQCLARNKMVYVESGLSLTGVIIYDLQGRVTAKDTSAASSYHFNLSFAPAGVYIIKVVCGNKTIVKKIIL